MKGKILLAATLTGVMGAFACYRVLARYITISPAPVNWGICLVFMFVPLVYTLINIRKASTLSLLQTLLVFIVAYDIYSFGCQKIAGLQMVVPLGFLDHPFNKLDGETLTWAYFRRSYPFTVTIGIAQITCALMLLLKRTRLLGLIMLIPILLNIIFIDYFYHLHIWVLLQAALLMTCVIYLLSQYFPQLRTFFFVTAPTLFTLPIGKPVHWVASSIVVVIPLFLLMNYQFPGKHPNMWSKYQVTALRVNGIPQQANSPYDSVLTTIYMDMGDDFVMEFNHYDRRFIGNFQFNPKSHDIKTKWRYPSPLPAPLQGSLIPIESSRNFTFSGTLGVDSIQMLLIYTPEPK